MDKNKMGIHAKTITAFLYTLQKSVYVNLYLPKRIIALVTRANTFQSTSIIGYYTWMTLTANSSSSGNRYMNKRIHFRWRQGQIQG